MIEISTDIPVFPLKNHHPFGVTLDQMSCLCPILSRFAQAY